MRSPAVNLRQEHTRFLGFFGARLEYPRSMDGIFQLGCGLVSWVEPFITQSEKDDGMFILWKCSVDEKIGRTRLFWRWDYPYNQPDVGELPGLIRKTQKGVDGRCHVDGKTSILQTGGHVFLIFVNHSKSIKMKRPVLGGSSHLAR